MGVDDVLVLLYTQWVCTAKPAGFHLGLDLCRCSGWAPAETSTVIQQGTPPSATELSGDPMFCGYPCSPTVDDSGLPSWIIAEGRQVTRHEKQGDTWYSYRDPSGVYVQVLRIPKGEKAPAVTGLGI